MEQEDRNKLLKMVIRCNKTKKHKPRKVLEPQLSMGGVDSPLFVESEIENKPFGRSETRALRRSLLKLAEQD